MKSGNSGNEIVMPVYNFSRDLLRPATTAHNGNGLIDSDRVLASRDRSAINFIDLVVIPVGASIGEHRHALTDEEIYIVIDGSGTMSMNGRRFEVAAGSVIHNPPGGTHGLTNTGTQALRLVVVDVQVEGSAYASPQNLSE